MASALPPDLQQIADAIDAADQAGAAIAARVTDEEFHWKPDGGRRWSIAECLDHLAALNVLYGVAVRTAVDKARQMGWTRQGPAEPGFFGTKFVASQEPPVKARLRAPQKVQPRPSRSRAEILGAYHAAHEEVRRLIADCAAIDTNRATFSNPFLPILKVRVSTALNVLPAHDRRHLWQAEQVEKELRQVAL
ncbi:MAG: DinB family protein [Acidobacteria bacterium]|nr:DinB family protein [Acidobacteriota bacterium]